MRIMGKEEADEGGDGNGSIQRAGSRAVIMVRTNPVAARSNCPRSSPDVRGGTIGTVRPAPKRFSCWHCPHVSFKAVGDVR